MSKDLAQLLGTGDSVVLETRQHWFVFVRAAWIHLLGIVPLVLVWWLAGKPSWLDNAAGESVEYVALAGVAVLALVVVWRIVQWRTERFYLTTTKVVYAFGVFNRNVVSTPYVKIDEVTLVRPLLGRMLGFGRLEVENAAHGRAPLAGLQYLPKPVELYQAITERARHQRMLEGSGREDTNNDGYVDTPAVRTEPEPSTDGRWTPPGSGTSTTT